jgi:hypothetical protein
MPDRTAQIAERLRCIEARIQSVKEQLDKRRTTPARPSSMPRQKPPKNPLLTR